LRKTYFILIFKNSVLEKKHIIISGLGSIPGRFFIVACKHIIISGLGSIPGRFFIVACFLR